MTEEAGQEIIRALRNMGHTLPEVTFEPPECTHVTIADELDIEMIPAGTRVSCVKDDGDGQVTCRGEINGIPRPLRIFSKNLKPIKVVDVTPSPAPPNG